MQQTLDGVLIKHDATGKVVFRSIASALQLVSNPRPDDWGSILVSKIVVFIEHKFGDARDDYLSHLLIRRNSPHQPSN